MAKTNKKNKSQQREREKDLPFLQKSKLKRLPEIRGQKKNQASGPENKKKRGKKKEGVGEGARKILTELRKFKKTEVGRSGLS